MIQMFNILVGSNENAQDYRFKINELESSLITENLSKIDRDIIYTNVTLLKLVLEYETQTMCLN